MIAATKYLAVGIASCAVSAALGATLAWRYAVAQHAAEMAEVTAKHEQAVRESVQYARDIERKMQDETNAALEKQARDSARVASNLARELDGLRQRAERAERMSADSRAACQGADGRELSRPDAEFLARLAARADEQRAALIACYAVLDAAQKNAPR